MSSRDDAPDRELIEQLKKSKTGRQANDALILLLDRHGDAAIHYVKRACEISMEEAEEVVERALVQAWRRIHTFDIEKGSFRPWFTKIAVNVKRQEIRDQARREKRVRSEDREILESTVSESDGSAEGVIKFEAQDLVTEFIKDKSPLDQALVRALMQHGDDPSVDDGIAQAQGKSVGYVKKRKSEVRSSLWEVLLENQYPVTRKRGGGR